jgi:hypothetical protein
MKRENVCGRCDFFHDDYAECRRHCPSVAGFPSVTEADWCGEFQPSQEHAPIEQEHNEADVDGFSSKEEYNNWRQVL